MKKYAFGVDIGGTTVKTGLFETGRSRDGADEGRLVESWEIPTDKSACGVNILPDIAKSVKAKLKELGLKEDDIEGIGLGVPGPVDPDGNVLKCVNLGWDIFNVEDSLKELTGFRVKAGNDANVAALGEMWQGGGKGHDNIVMVTLGTGVGAGVILDRKILAGINGAAGEIGHMPVRDPEEETETCGCGKRGCLEQYCSATGVVRLAEGYLKNNPETLSKLKDAGRIDSKIVFDLAKEGDKAALEILEEFSEILGRALASVACVVNADIFVLGGGVSKAGPILTEKVGEKYKKYAFHACADTPFALAVLGNDAGMYGAVYQLY